MAASMRAVLALCAGGMTVGKNSTKERLHFRLCARSFAYPASIYRTSEHAEPQVGSDARDCFVIDRQIVVSSGKIPVSLLAACRGFPQWLLRYTAFFHNKFSMLDDTSVVAPLVWKAWGTFFEVYFEYIGVLQIGSC